MKDILKKLKKFRPTRITILGGLLLCMAAALVGRLYQLQILHGEEYAKNFVMKTKREIQLKGVRGNIYDRNGKLLAGNKLVYAITFRDSQTYDTSRERQLSLNGTIYRLLKILEANGDSPMEYLKIYLDDQGQYRFSVEGTSLDRFRADVYGKVSDNDMNQEQRSADEEEVIEYLAGEDQFCLFSQNGKEYTAREKKQYGLPESFSREEILSIVSIRYALSLQTYQKYLAVTVTENASDATVAAVAENQEELPGVAIEENTMRIYDGGEACASIIGYTGQISPEELEEKEKDGYTGNSVVGKAGMEQFLEEYLHGEDGKMEILVDNMGRILSKTGQTRQPQTGEDVYLTIDLELQQKVYDILEKKISEILLENIVDEKTFDKESISDSTEIRIPIYDVYCAFFDNHVLNTEDFTEDDATDLEKKVQERYEKQKKVICREIAREIKEDSGTEKMRIYESFILENIDLLYDAYKEDADPFYEKWLDGSYTLADYLNAVISEGWVKDEVFEGEGEYLTQKEMFESAVDYIVEALGKNSDFDILVYDSMVMNDKISPEEICQLLYDQGALEEKGNDYRAWKAGQMSSYEFIRAKIQSLEITPADLALDPCSGSAVVTDTDTGEVLACVSYPGYDNNRLANNMDNAYYYSLSENAALPLYNRATQQLSAPGSTFKPITLIAGLEEGVIDTDTTVVCDGIFDKVSPALRCWNHTGHGEVTSVAAALRHSCNDYLCEVSYRLGMKGNREFSDVQALGYLQKYAKLFHLDEKSGIELTESSPQVTDSYAIPSAIGQGTNNYATVQLGRYVNTLANEGSSYKLTLIHSIGQNTGKKEQAEPESKIVLAQSTWNSIHKGMQMYVESTGVFKDFDLSVAGKSGTAQESRERPDHGLFIGYAPADDPEISLAVRIVNGYTSENAVACGREILSAYFHKEKVKNR